MSLDAILDAVGEHQATDPTYREGWHAALASVRVRLADENRERPLNTIRADVEGTGEAFLPAVFASDFQRLTAALDWARVYAGDSAKFGLLAQELAAASRYARSLATECEEWARTADNERTD